MAEDHKIEYLFDAKTDGFVANVQKIKLILEGLINPINGISKQLGELAEAFAAAWAVEKIEHFVEKISDMGENVEQATHQLGMSAEQVTSLTTSLNLAGISMDSGIFLLTHLERGMSQAMQAAGPAREAFTALGISMNDLKSMSPEDVLRKTAEAFEKTKDGANKNDIAWHAFGRGAQQMIPLLDEGLEGLDRGARIAEETGTRMSGPMVLGMRQTAEAIKELGLAFTGLGITIYEALKPQVDTIIRALIDMVEWLNNGFKSTGLLNGALATIALLSAVVVGALFALVDAFRALFTGLGTFVDAARVLWPVFSEMVADFTRVIVGRLSGIWMSLFSEISSGWQIVATAGKDAMAALLDTISPIIRKMGIIFSDLFDMIASGWAKIGGGDIAEKAQSGLEKIGAKFKNALDTVGGDGKSFTKEMGDVYDKYSDKIKESTDKAVAILKKGDEDGAAIADHFIRSMKSMLSNIQGLNTLQGGIGIDVTGNGPKPKEQPKAELPALKKEDTERMAALEAELRREEMGWQIHWDQLKEFEAAYWAGILARTSTSAKDYDAIFNKMYSSQEALAHERVAKEGTLEKEETSNLKSELDARQQQQTAADDFNVQHGLMKVSEKIAAERRLTEDIFTQIRARLEYEKNTVGQMPEFYRKVNEEIVQLEQKHNGDLAALNRDSVADFIKPWEDATAAINSSMDTMLNGILMGTQSFSDAMKNLWNNLVLTLIEYELKLLIVKVSNTAKEAVLNNGMIMSWFGMETAKSTISEGAAAQRAAVDTTAQTGFFGHIGGWLGQWFGFEEAKTTTTEAAAAQRATVTSAATIAGNVALVAAAFGQIQVEAALAAAATFAAISAIPIIGPELAPEAAAEAYITTMGFASGLGGGLAFERGGLIPQGVNPIAQLHQNEMILPAKLSQGMQGLIASGGVGAGGGDTTINVHVAGSNASPDSIARAVSQAMRDFHPAFRRR